MAVALTSLAALGNLPFDEIIDVRSPAEFAEDHVPGAISLPVLSDAERAEVGTLYKQVDSFTARKIGAALVARNAAAHLEGPLKDRPFLWRPLVYCWRGGQRSGSFASILQQIGWKAETVEGGYKSYRRLVVSAVYDDEVPHRIVLIDGNTGSAKTRLLEVLAEEGAQVIDLEGMANHRGSLLGGRPGGQPSQKMFESRIAMALAATDPGRPVFVEAEAAKVGDLGVPKAMWKAMMAAPRAEIAAPLEARAAYLVEAYADLIEDRPRLTGRIEALRPYHPAERIADWLGMVARGEMRQLALELMRDHYDPRYASSAKRRAPVAQRIDVDGLGDEALRGAAVALIRAAESRLAAE